MLGREYEHQPPQAVGSRSVNKNNAKIAQLVEHHLAKVGVAGSNPVFRSESKYTNAEVVELVDTLDLKSNGHYGRAGSSPAFSTDKKPEREFWFFCFQKARKACFSGLSENKG